MFTPESNFIEVCGFDLRRERYAGIAKYNFCYWRHCAFCKSAHRSFSKPSVLPFTWLMVLKLKGYMYISNTTAKLQSVRGFVYKCCTVKPAVPKLSNLIVIYSTVIIVIMSHLLNRSRDDGKICTCLSVCRVINLFQVSTADLRLTVQNW